MSVDDTITPIEFIASGATPDEKKANLAVVKPSPGFETAAGLISETVIKDSDVTVLDFTAQQVDVRFRIDGIWHAGMPMDRETGDYLLATLKQLSGIDYRERRVRQEGSFKTMYLKKTQTFRLVSQGVPTGERVALYLDYKREPLETAKDLGMRESMVKQLIPMLANLESGNILVAGVPGEGYTSAWRGVLNTCDRLTRDFYVLEEKGHLEPDVINVNPVEFDPAAGENAMSPVQQLMLKEPDVLAFPELPDGELIDQIVDLSNKENMPIFTRHAGKNCIDALLRLLLKKPDVKKFVERLDAVVSMRVIRILCEQCKIGFQPPPALCHQLGLPPGRVAELFKPYIFQPGTLDEEENEILPCPGCSGIGYRGRTGLFELLVMNDDLRKTIIATPRLDQIAAVAKQHGHISMQMEGVVLIAKGTTSIEELQRILKA